MRTAEFLFGNPMFYVCMICCITVIALTANCFSNWENGNEDQR